MYESFFGLREQPFNLTSDPRYFYLGQSQRHVLVHISQALRDQQGLIVVTGEAGLGKTALLYHLVAQLNKHTQTAFILYPRLSFKDFLHYMLKDFGIEADVSTPIKSLSRLEDFLSAQHAQGHRTVLVIDEAQQFPLEHLQTLLSLEAVGEKLLQIILAGQRQLQDNLHLPNWQGLSQGISTVCEVFPLSLAETQAYITHRFAVAGGDAEAVFPPQVFATIHRYTRGFPRLIHILCDHALLEARWQEKRHITPDLIEQMTCELTSLFRFPPVAPPGGEYSETDGSAPVADAKAGLASDVTPPSSSAALGRQDDAPQAVLMHEPLAATARARTFSLWRGSRKWATILTSVVLLGTALFLVRHDDKVAGTFLHLQTLASQLRQSVQERFGGMAMTHLAEWVERFVRRGPQPVPSGRAQEPAQLPAALQVNNVVRHGDVSPVDVVDVPFQVTLGNEPVILEDTTTTREAEVAQFPVHITAQGGESVRQHAKVTYGFVSEPLMQLIMAHNPHLQNTHDLQAGTTFILPAPDALIK